MEERVPILPLIILGAIAIPLIAGCSQIKDPFKPAKCSTSDKPDEYKHVRDESYRVFKSLFPAEFEKGSVSPWLKKWLTSTNANMKGMRDGLGAADTFFETDCSGKITIERDIRHFERYRAHSEAFFRDYFSKSYDSADYSVLVLLGGLAPIDAGESVVLDGLNSLIVPTEKKSLEREQRSEMCQIFKAAYSYNLAAAKLDPDSRYKLKHGKNKLSPSDVKYVRLRLGWMESTLDDIQADILTDEQRVFYDTLVEAGRNLRKSIVKRKAGSSN
jgi:hypothetical protein